MQRSGERVLWHGTGRGILPPSRKVDAGIPREEDSWNLEHKNALGYRGGVKQLGYNKPGLVVNSSMHLHCTSYNCA